MFSVSLQLSGRVGSSAATPAAKPRNCGHWSVAETACSANSVNPTVTIEARIIVLSLPNEHYIRLQLLVAVGMNTKDTMDAKETNVSYLGVLCVLCVLCVD